MLARYDSHPQADSLLRDSLFRLCALYKEVYGWGCNWYCGGKVEAVEAKTMMGRPAEVIIEESADYDLVICATLGKTGFARVLLGSVAENVVRLAKCPVLVCR